MPFQCVAPHLGARINTWNRESGVHSDLCHEVSHFSFGTYALDSAGEFTGNERFVVTNQKSSQNLLEIVQAHRLGLGVHGDAERELFQVWEGLAELKVDRFVKIYVARD